MPIRIILLIAVLLGAALEARPSESNDPAVQAAARFFEGITEAKLDNGLRVYLKPVPASAVVSTMLAYKVGSADEDLEHTGLAHYLEHLMFKGTDKLFPGDIDRLTLRNSGMNNASTSRDLTVYHFDLPADQWEVALQIESDRMRNLRIDSRHEFEQEKGAVIAELDRNEDEPWDLEEKAITPLLFGSGPYGHPVIGERAHVRGATAAVIKGFYDRWYHPNNAVLVMCGGFDADKALVRIKSLFGAIPQGQLPPRRGHEPVKRSGPVRKEFTSKFATARLLLGFNTVSDDHSDAVALDVLDAVLSGGKTGRLYRRLVEEEKLAQSASSSHSSGRLPGWLSIQVELLQGKDRRRTEQVVSEEIQRLCSQEIRAEELTRVKRMLTAQTIFSLESMHSQAGKIARTVALFDLERLKSYLPRIQAVTASDIQRVARKYLDLNRQVAVWSIPPAEGKQSALLRKERTVADGLARTGAGGKDGSAGFSLTRTRRTKLANGITLLLLENRQLPIFFAEAYVADLQLHEPPEKAGVAALTASLLDEGTSKYTGRQLAELIEGVGGELSFSSAGGSVKVLSQDRSLGLGLLFECLARARFPSAAFERNKARHLTNLADAERQPETKAGNLFRELAYGSHPLGRPAEGRISSVGRLGSDDCIEFHRRVFVPNNTVVAVVGDFDSSQVIEEVSRLTSGWKPGELARPRPAEPEKPKEFVTRFLTMPEAAQLQFYLGHVGIRRNHPDYYKLLVMDYVLGTGAGFTDRLSARLRDREGLAYTVSASITSSASNEPGLFTCYIGTMPNELSKVRRIFLEELGRIQSETPKAEEVSDVKQYLLGSLAFKFTSGERIAAVLLSLERAGLDLDYVESYRRGVAAVTPEDVRAVARKYIDPKRMILVAVGPISADGSPLPPKK